MQQGGSMRGIIDTLNIIKKSDKYCVVVSKDGKLKQLATGRTLIEALMMRDWCRENGWIPFVRRLQFIQEHGPGIYQIYKYFKQNDGSYKKICFGSYRTVEDAIEERDLLIKHNWDFEALCSLE